MRWALSTGLSLGSCNVSELDFDGVQGLGHVDHRRVSDDKRLAIPQEDSPFYVRRSAQWAADRNTFVELEAVPMGTHLSAAQVAGKLPSIHTWFNLGFVVDKQGGVQRVADLVSPLPALVLFERPELSEIDCLAVSSIDRRNGEVPYLYATLRLLFATFPQGIEVNVLVGSDDDDYVSSAALAEHVGSAHLGQIHIHRTDATTTAFLRAHLNPSRRGGWNYSRALRSYAGSRGIVVIEDDVRWTHGGIERFNAWLQGRPLPAVSLYNSRCAELSGSDDFDNGTLTFSEVNAGDVEFWNTQAMYFAQPLAAVLGRHTQLRMGPNWAYDNVISAFFKLSALRMAYAFPSIVQHTGAKTACESGGFHISSCFVESLPPG